MALVILLMWFKQWQRISSLTVRYKNTSKRLGVSFGNVELLKRAVFFEKISLSLVLITAFFFERLMCETDKCSFHLSVIHCKISKIARDFLLGNLFFSWFYVYLKLVTRKIFQLKCNFFFYMCSKHSLHVYPIHAWWLLLNFSEFR